MLPPGLSFFGRQVTQEMAGRIGGSRGSDFSGQLLGVIEPQHTELSCAAPSRIPSGEHKLRVNGVHSIRVTEEGRKNVTLTLTSAATVERSRMDDIFIRVRGTQLTDMCLF